MNRISNQHVQLSFNQGWQLNQKFVPSWFWSRIKKQISVCRGSCKDEWVSKDHDMYTVIRIASPDSYQYTSLVMTLWVIVLMTGVPASAQTSVRTLLHADPSGQGQHAASRPHCQCRRRLYHLFNSSLHHHRKTPLTLHCTDWYLFFLSDAFSPVFFFFQPGPTDQRSYQSSSLVFDERLCFLLCTTTFISHWRD